MLDLKDFFLNSKENNQIRSQDATGFVLLSVLQAETLVSLPTDPPLLPWGIDVRAVDQEHPFIDSHLSAAWKPFSHTARPTKVLKSLKVFFPGSVISPLHYEDNLSANY